MKTNYSLLKSLNLNDSSSRFILTLFIILFFNLPHGGFLYAQQSLSLCHTEMRDPNPSKLDQDQKNLIDIPYTVKVYLHIINKTDGTGGQSEDVIPIIQDKLKDAFSSHDILFQYTCSINYINKDEHYAASVSSLQGGADAIDALDLEYGHDDGIDIFLGPNNTVMGDVGGLAIPGGTSLRVQGTYTDLYGEIHTIAETHVVSHEVGHILSLDHTHINTEDGPNSSLAELVSGANASTHGDMIADTPADPNIAFGLRFWDNQNYVLLDENCNWIIHDVIADAETIPYEPDVTNFMSYSLPSCISSFSDDQVLQMKDNLYNDAVIRACVVSTVGITDTKIEEDQYMVWTTADTDINGDIFVEGDLIIENGATLNIQDGVTVRFSGTSNVYVHPNGVLRLYGILTSNEDCGQWQGIDVWGSEYGVSQDPVNVVEFEQGRLYIYGTGAIENAIIAAELYGPDPNHSGGQIYCNGATFRDNAKAIVFKSFTGWAQDEQPKYYRSTIRNSSFITTENYNLTEKFEGFIEMQGILGINIKGCSFVNNHFYTGANSIDDYGYGIKATGSYFNVMTQCNDVLPSGETCYNYTPCSFEGLGYGIDVADVIPSYPATIKQTLFKDCYIGIKNSTSESTTMLFNTFNMGNVPDLNVDTNDEGGHQTDQIGILLEQNTSGFTLTGNHFIKESGGNLAEGGGFVIGTLSDNTGEFNNEIKNNEYTGVSIGNMAEERNKFLLFLCNRHENNSTADMYIPDDSSSDENVHYNQRGTNGLGEHIAAGNKFYNSTSSFKNQGTQDYLVYFHDPGSPEEIPVNLEEVSINVANPNACEIEHCEPPCKTVFEIDILKENYTAYKDIYDVNKAELGQLIDRGAGQTEIEAKKSDVDKNKRLLDATTQMIVMHLQLDTIGFDNQELETWLLNKNAYGVDMKLALEKKLTDQHTEANTILNNMSSRYELNASQLADIGAITEVLDLLEDQNIYDLKPETVVALEPFAYSQIGTSSAIARNILTNYGYHFQPRYHIDIDSKGEKALKIIQEDGKPNQMVVVSPNPSTGIFRFVFKPDQLPDSNTLLRILDANGGLISSHMIEKGALEFTWTANRHTQSGIYYYQVISDENILASGKLLIQK